ncbi:MAG: alpha-ketoglutarate-dependent dioxygenase AlkB [Bacteroidota bacterium]
MQTDLFSSSDPYVRAQAMIPGLSYVQDYIPHEMATELLHGIQSEPWLTDLRRRVQHYGYKYDYRRRNIDRSMALGGLPDWSLPLARRLVDTGHMPALPDQLIVNEYLPGQGITDHVDCEPCFEDHIVSLSLGAPYVMRFTEKADRSNVVPLLLPPHSLIALSGDARYAWMHGIKAVKTETWQGRKFPRGKRTSLTFRKVILRPA